MSKRTLDLDSLDLSPILSAAEKLLAEAKRYNKWLDPSECQSSSTSLSLHMAAAIAAIELEQQLQRIAMGGEFPSLSRVADEEAVELGGKQDRVIPVLGIWECTHELRASGVWDLGTRVTTLPRIPEAILGKIDQAVGMLRDVPFLACSSEAKPNTPGQETACELADGQLWINGEPFRLEPPESNVLEAIAKHGALNKTQLGKLSLVGESAEKVLKKLGTKYRRRGLQVRPAGKKGKGGYWANVKIRDAPNP